MPDADTVRDLAIEIYQLFETHSRKRAIEMFGLYDDNPKNLPLELRWMVKQSYAAAELAADKLIVSNGERNAQDL